MEDQELTEKIIGCAMRVHSTLGPGFLESVYQNALAHELRKAGLKVECEKASWFTTTASLWVISQLTCWLKTG